MTYSILFTGHMIDAKERKHPRFPSSKEDIIRARILKCLAIEKGNKELVGIAGGACGGDILFHEACLQMHIDTRMYLAKPIDEFKKTSVSFAGRDWIKRFDWLQEKTPVYTMPEPGHPEENIWELANLFMFKEAVKNGSDHMCLIALWDGKEGDGNGGTAHMIELAKKYGAKIVIIQIDKL